MKFLTASALALTVAAGGAMAQDSSMKTASENSEAMSAMKDDLIRTRDITGGAIYTMDEANDEGWDGAEYDSVGADWNEIGTIEDIVLSRDGQMKGVVAEVGGFLDIADKHVMISIDDVRLVPVDDTSLVLLTRMNEEEMEALPSVDEGFWN
ncbi:PRC-barrel domain-containing protein [Roseovarius nanhaiticus]|uniref:PRC-barrel domain-containing protein n=1 Tax=Roseovarius nanhaiticus TaxID=573024 RepID=A0A1N7FPT6_9RHOB|nr:PRC-barrel domain-containing protein [Roseovarius nanhaiticus]SEK48726.1 PRC-barrel domain-containing protein [Roseovarius nanhaiticus]SIS02372.1 PRC-barrel domain-containing protein [Roseovarius nanhaiticus]